MQEPSTAAVSEAVLDVVPGDVYVIGADGSIDPHRAESTVGFPVSSVGTLRETDVRDVLDEETARRVLESVEAVLESDEETSLRYNVAGVGPVEANLTPLPETTVSDGRVLALVREIEIDESDVATKDGRELRETKRRLDLALAETNTGIWEWNVETDDVVWSDDLERIAGLEPGEFGGTFEAFAGCVHPADVDDVEAAVERAIQDGTFYQTEFRFERDDGEDVWVDARGQVVSAEDGPDRMVGIVTDVTERKQRTQERMHRERQFRQLVERLHEAYYAFDGDWHVTHCNEALAERVDRSREDIVGANFWEAFPSLRDTVVETTFHDVMETGEPATCEHYYEPKDYWVELQAFPHDDGIAVVSTDITDRKKRLSAILDFAPIILFSMDQDGVIQESRGQALTKLGLEPGELVGESVYEMYADEPDIIESMEAALGGEEVRTKLEVAGTMIETKYKPIVEDGEVTGAIGVSMDITELERRREQLLTLTEATDELLYATTVEETAERVVEMATDLLSTVDVEYWAVAEDGDELVPVDLVGGGGDVGDGESAGSEDGPARISEGTWEMEAFREGELCETADYGAIEEPAARDRTGSALAVPLDEHGLLTLTRPEPGGFGDGTLALVRLLARSATAGLDAAEREQALESYKEQLEASNERLEQFAYVASHDLQEPLRTISNYVDLLVAEYGDELEDEADGYVETVTTGCERMQSMIDGLLDYSRVTTRGDEFVPVDTERAVTDVADDLAYKLEETEGALEWSDELPTVEADPDQLRQLFQNLVKNALEHASEPVTMQIRASETGSAYRFEVEDDGPGIEENRHEKIFRIFKSGTQYHESGQAKGIGLAICDNIVQRHDGEIWVESEPGQGSSFLFTIPKQ